MNFLDTFLASLQIQKIADTASDVNTVIPDILRYDTISQEDNPNLLIYAPLVNAAGTISVLNLNAFILTDFPYATMLYTENGNGRLTVNEKEYAVPEHTLALIAPDTNYTFQPTILPWKFKLIFFQYNHSPFMQLFKDKPVINMNIPSQSNVLLNLNVLTTLPVHMTEASFVSAHMALNGILSFLYFVEMQSIAEHDDAFLPSNVLKIKSYLDAHYSEEFSLTLLEKLFYMSKYQICHIFSKHLGISPLQYINKLRLTQAKKLLLTSEYSINEISSIVGFDNYSHFARLFKREYGLTPAAFRQLALEN